MKQTTQVCRMMKKWSLLLFSISLFSSAHTQNNQNDNLLTGSDVFSDIGASVYSNMELPPLNILLENAKSSAALEYYEKLKQQEESELVSIKRDWLKYFRVEGNYRYGKNYYQSASDQVIIQLPNKDKLQSWYSVGVSLSIPLDDIIDTGQRRKQQRLRIEALNDQMESTYTDMKIVVVDLYSQALKELNLLKVRIEEMTLNETRYKDAEADFLRGRIDTQELSAHKKEQTLSIQNYIESKHTLNSVLLKLELLTNTQILGDEQTTQK